MIQLFKDILPVFKFLIGTFSCFLILLGIHWIAILAGILLGVIYFVIPKKSLN